jgi:hypothetical protein
MGLFNFAAEKMENVQLAGAAAFVQDEPANMIAMANIFEKELSEFLGNDLTVGADLQEELTVLLKVAATQPRATKQKYQAHVAVGGQFRTTDKRLMYAHAILAALYRSAFEIQKGNQKYCARFEEVSIMIGNAISALRNLRDVSKEGGTDADTEDYTSPGPQPPAKSAPTINEFPQAIQENNSSRIEAQAVGLIPAAAYVPENTSTPGSQVEAAEPSSPGDSDKSSTDAHQLVLIEMQQRIADLGGQISELGSERDDLRQQADAAQRELTSAGEYTKVLAREISQIGSERDELRQQADAAQGEIASMAERIKGLEDETGQMGRDRDEWRQQAELAQRRLKKKNRDATIYFVVFVVVVLFLAVLVLAVVSG